MKSQVPIARNFRHFASAIASGRSKRIAVSACAVHITNMASSQNIVHIDILELFFGRSLSHRNSNLMFLCHLIDFPSI